MVSALGEDISDGVIHPEEKVKVKVRTGNDLSSPAFFSNGSTCADLKSAGNFPVCSDKLACVVMAGAKCSIWQTTISATPYRPQSA